MLLLLLLLLLLHLSCLFIYFIQGDKDAIKVLVDKLVTRKNEYKEKSGKEYGAAPAKEKKEKENKKDAVVKKAATTTPVAVTVAVCK